MVAECALRVGGRVCSVDNRCSRGGRGGGAGARGALAATSIGPASAIVNADAEAAEPTIVDAHEPGGVPSAMKAVPAVPAPTEDTIGVELASVAEGATTVKPEVLEPWARGEARRERSLRCQPNAS